MITNERQHRISKAQLAKLRSAVKDFDIAEISGNIGSRAIAEAELSALKSEEAELSAQVKEYEALKSGAVTILKAKNLKALPTLLIRARVAQGLSQRELADILGMKVQQIQRYESEQYASASFSRLAEITNALHLNISEVAELSPLPLSYPDKEPSAIDWASFPIKEMYRRNWFEDFHGSCESAVADAESLIRSYVTNVVRRPTLALYRKRVRSSSVLDPYALLAWECRVLTLAKKQLTGATFRWRQLDDDWFTKLAQESLFEDGPIRARKYLEKVGISLVIEPHLPNTYLDGAAFLYRKTPVIGLTLRYDRLDNFWFVLMHEVIHIRKHLRKGRVESIFDDLEADPDRVEREADILASRALIPDQDWETALARYVRSKNAVRSLADKLGINPAIVAGRIRNEANNYVILSDLVGQSQVRKLFPEASFGQ